MKFKRRKIPKIPVFKSLSSEETQEIGCRIGALTEPGDLILLVGELGTGKTCFTQGLAWALDVDEYVSSPSFVLMREYYGRHTLYHIDLYRLTNATEIIDLGIDEYLNSGGICMVEWADRSMASLPTKYLLIRFDYLVGDQRSLQFESRGLRYKQMLAQFR